MEIFTIGHSTQSYDQFCKTLIRYEIDVVADVRSAPFSRHFPHFTGENLKSELRSDGIKYVFMGEELGGRPKKSEFFCDDVADYEKMAQSRLFKDGVKRIFEGAKRYKIVLMCSERNPLDCHRCLLVGRVLSEKGFRVSNILGDGSISTQSEIERQLLELSGESIGQQSLLQTSSELISESYRKRSMQVAFKKSEKSGHGVSRGLEHVN